MLSAICLIVLGVLAVDQNKKVKEENEKIEASVKLMDTDPKQSLVDLKQFLGKRQDNFLIHQNIGNIYAIIQQPEKAVESYEAALKENPFLIKDPFFVLQFAQYSFYNGDIQKAKFLVEHAKKLGIPKTKGKFAKQLVMIINRTEGYK
jgi:tetratricopeptide (TPR) repeat protein